MFFPGEDLQGWRFGEPAHFFGFCLSQCIAEAALCLRCFVCISVRFVRVTCKKKKKKDSACSVRRLIEKVDSYILKGQCHDIQWFIALFCASKKWLLLAQVSRTSPRFAARTVSPSRQSRATVVFLEQLSFSAALPCGRHYFSPHKMAAKNPWLSWHCITIGLKHNFETWRDIFKRFFFLSESLSKIKCFGTFLEKLYHFKVPKKVKMGEKCPKFYRF